MPTIISDNTTAGSSKLSANSTINGITKDITRIDSTIAETLKPLEIVVEEQSKAIDNLTKNNKDMSNTNLSLSNTNFNLSKHIEKLRYDIDDIEKSRILLRTNLTIYKRYSLFVSILVIIETCMLLFR